MSAGVIIQAISPTVAKVVQPPAGAVVYVPIFIGIVILAIILGVQLVRHPDWRPVLGLVACAVALIWSWTSYQNQLANAAIVDGQHQVIHIVTLNKHGVITSQQDVKFSDIRGVTMQYNRGDTRLALLLNNGNVVLPLGPDYIQDEPMHFRAQTLIENALKTGHVHSIRITRNRKLEEEPKWIKVYRSSLKTRNN